MSNAKCKNCQYFYPHYVLGEQKIGWVNCGHCVFPKLRHKRPDTPACPHFVQGEADTARFADKRYLSKALLNYVLSLELLPEIKEAVLAEKSNR